jgi:hypothetical protein
MEKVQNPSNSVYCVYYFSLRILLPSSLPQSPGIDYRAVCIGFVVGIVTLGQTFLLRLPTFPVSYHSIITSHSQTVHFLVPHSHLKPHTKKIYSFINSLFCEVVVSLRVRVTSGKIIMEKMPWPTSKYSPDICLEGLRNITRLLSKDSRCTDQDCNKTPLEYKPNALPSDPPCSETRPHAKQRGKTIPVTGLEGS